jgi:hypothetical protein
VLFDWLISLILSHKKALKLPIKIGSLRAFLWLKIYSQTVQLIKKVILDKLHVPNLEITSINKNNELIDNIFYK